MLYVTDIGGVKVMSVKKSYVFLGVLLLCFLVISAFFLRPIDPENDTPLQENGDKLEVTFEWLLEPRYQIVNDFRFGVAWVQEERDGPWTLIDISGKTLIENFQAGRIWTYGVNTELAPYRNLEDFEGYIDLSGDVAISPEYEFVRSFKNGVAVVTNEINDNLRRGVIDQRGKILLPIVYEDIYVIHSDLFVAKKDGKYGYVNDKNQSLTDFIFEKPYQSVFPPNVCLAVLGNKSGLLDEKGKWIVSPSYDQVYAGREGLIGLGKGGKAGFVDTKGNTVIDFQFLSTTSGKTIPYVYTFSEGLAVVLLPEFQVVGGKKRNLRGVIDKEGKLLFKFPGYPISLFSKEFLLVQGFDDSYALLDRSGNRYPLPSYVEVDDFGQEDLSEKILRVKVRENTARYEKGKYGFLRINVK